MRFSPWELLFWKVVGNWEYQIPLIKSVRGERALQVQADVADVNFQVARTEQMK